jgi:MerR family transcriptional regulator, light-induced transcriptional regulator
MVNAVELDLATLDGFITEMSDGDKDAASALVAAAREDTVSLDTIVSGLVSPALVEAGHRWAAAEVGVSESRAAATIVRAVLGQAAPSAPPAEQGAVVVCCTEGEAHDLAAEMVAEVWRSHGWPARIIAAEMQPLDVEILLRRHRPAALLVSCTTPCGLPGAARMIEAANEAGVPAVAGGAGFGRDNARAIRLGAAAWAPTVDAGIAVLEEWETSPRVPASNGAINEDYAAFTSARSDIVAGAMATLRSSKFRRREDAIDVATAQSGLELLLCYIEAALLVDDQRVLVDYLTWMTGFSRDHDATVTRLSSLLEAVSGEIPVASPRGGRFVQDGLRHLEWNRRPGTDRSASHRANATSLIGRAEAAQPTTGAEVQQGQVFADLLFLAAVSCHAPMALISVVQPDGQWSTLSYGVDRREALNEPGLFAAVAAGVGPIELPDLAADAGRRGSALATGPLAVRFFYGHPLRTSLDSTLGVFCVMDRRVRQLSGAEHQAMGAIARQVTDQIVLWRRTTAPRADAIQTGPRRRSSDRIGGNRPGPDAALVELIGLRRPGSGVEQHLLRSHEVAVLFDVTERTVINWAASKKLPSLRTAGGHLRFRSEDVVALLAGRTTASPASS